MIAIFAGPHFLAHVPNAYCQIGGVSRRHHTLMVSFDCVRAARVKHVQNDNAALDHANVIHVQNVLNT